MSAGTSDAPGQHDRPDAPTRRRRGIVLAVVVVILGVVLAEWGRRRWWTGSASEDAPRIGLSLDSFWLNETGITEAAFERAVTRSGGRLVLLEAADAGDPVVPERVAEMLEAVDGVIIGGGGDVDPERYGGEAGDPTLLDPHGDAFQLELLNQAESLRVPVLGICRGAQLMNVWRGGTLRTLEGEAHARHFMNLSGHDVLIEERSELADVMGRTRWSGVMSTHQQALERLGDGIVPVAWADPERTEIEGIEVRSDAWMIGVIWHPEREALGDDAHLAPFEALVRRAAEAAATRRK